MEETKSVAAVLVGREEVEIRNLPVPGIGVDDALLEVEATGVCGSDGAAYMGKLDFWETPSVLGHETVGTIGEIGRDAANRWSVDTGDRVAVEEYLPCGTCKHCLAAQYAVCRRSPRYGARSLERPPGLWGGYSQYMYLHPQTIVHRVPKTLPAHLAQLFIPIANGLHWTQGLGRARTGCSVVVLGPGPHGLGCVIGAKEVGAAHITVVGLERDAYRLKVARELGADETLIYRPEDEIDLLQAVSRLTGGEMADTVVNVTDSPDGLALAVELAAFAGTVVQAGVASTPSSRFDSGSVWKKALTVHGVRGRPSALIPRALRLIAAGQHAFEEMCTHRFPIEGSDEALRLVRTGDDDVIRAVISGSSGSASPGTSKAATTVNEGG